MKASGVYPSKYLKADDLQGKPYTLTIEKVEMEDSFGEEKPVLYFRETEKKFTVAPSNWRILVSELEDDETDNWKGARVTLTPTRRKIAGELKSVIDVTGAQMPTGGASTAARSYTQPAAAPFGGNPAPSVESEEIPF